MREDGTLDCHQPRGFKKVTAGSQHSCAILSDGTAHCWGRGANGRLGNGQTVDRRTPVAVRSAGGPLTNVIDIAAGYDHTCAIVGATEDATSGSVWCWGTGTNGKLGNDGTANQAFAVQVIGLTNAVRVSAGYIHTCALLEGNRAKCWGRNANGRLGHNGSTNDSPVPVDVAIDNTALTDVLDISAGYASTCMVRAGGSAWCWGADSSGVLGNGSEGNSNTPMEVMHLSSGVARIFVSSGYYGNDNWRPHACALRNDGQVWCWGANNSGQLGNNSTTNSQEPIQVRLDHNDDGQPDNVFLTGAQDLALGGGFTCAIVGADKSLYCWGYNGHYQLANGSNVNRSMAVPVHAPDGADTLRHVVSVSGGNYTGNAHMIAVVQEPGAATGTALAAGNNAYGQLGDNTTTASGGGLVRTLVP